MQVTADFSSWRHNFSSDAICKYGQTFQLVTQLSCYLQFEKYESIQLLKVDFHVLIYINIVSSFLN